MMVGHDATIRLRRGLLIVGERPILTRYAGCYSLQSLILRSYTELVPVLAKRLESDITVGVAKVGVPDALAGSPLQIECGEG